MRIGMRLLLGYFLIVAVAAWFVISIFGEEIKPGVRRATEGMLNDSATLLAEIARDDLLSGQPAQGNLARAFARLNNRPINANISGIVKNKNEYRVYLTDAAGKVVYDSSGQATGQDYSRWNVSGSPFGASMARAVHNAIRTIRKARLCMWPLR